MNIKNLKYFEKLDNEIKKKHKIFKNTDRTIIAAIKDERRIFKFLITLPPKSIPRITAWQYIRTEYHTAIHNNMFAFIIVIHQIGIFFCCITHSRRNN